MSPSTPVHEWDSSAAAVARMELEDVIEIARDTLVALVVGMTAAEDRMQAEEMDRELDFDLALNPALWTYGLVRTMVAGLVVRRYRRCVEGRNRALCAAQTPEDGITAPGVQVEAEGSCSRMINRSRAVDVGKNCRSCSRCLVDCMGGFEG